MVTAAGPFVGAELVGRVFEEEIPVVCDELILLVGGVGVVDGTTNEDGIPVVEEGADAVVSLDVILGACLVVG